jgi:peptidoglycan/LPS O-acetylase OafA/YrhL
MLAKTAVRRALLALSVPLAIGAVLWIETTAASLEGTVYICYQIARLGLCFQLGGLYREFANFVPLRIELAAALLAAMFLLVGTPAFTSTACFAIAYLTFWCAFVPNGKCCRLTRRAPDYSYGLYIYAFPIQQSLISAIPNARAVEVIFLGFVITLAFAALSWHWIEKPALALKGASGIWRQKSPPGLVHIDENRAHPVQNNLAQE